MIRLNRLFRTVKSASKIPARAGVPGWDRPDVPLTQRVEITQKWTQQEIYYTFFDSSMPQFFISQPEIYEGSLMEGLPSLFKIWGLFLGVVTGFCLLKHFINPSRTHLPYEPVVAEQFLKTIKRLNQQKVYLKFSKENPFGISKNINKEAISNQKFPYNIGGIWYPKRYYLLKASTERVQLINQQARSYLKKALQRASKPNTSQNHH